MPARASGFVPTSAAEILRRLLRRVQPTLIRSISWPPSAFVSPARKAPSAASASCDSAIVQKGGLKLEPSVPADRSPVELVRTHIGQQFEVVHEDKQRR
jgi:hypothetical protein